MEREERGKKAETEERKLGCRAAPGSRPIHSGSLSSVSQVFLGLYSDSSCPNLTLLGQFLSSRRRLPDILLGFWQGPGQGQASFFQAKGDIST